MHCGTTLVPLLKGDFYGQERQFRTTFNILPPNCEKKFGSRSKNAASIPSKHSSSQLVRTNFRRAIARKRERILRPAATLTNLAKQVQGLRTLGHAQVARGDVFLQYVITCVVELPEDALPAARVRARLRYEKLVCAAAKEISNKNRDTLREMVADE